MSIAENGSCKGDIRYVILLSLALVGFSFFLQGNIGLNLTDEGFLWYGAIHTAQGEIPMRDFLSYDPGRYYWCAAWMLIFGKGILALHLSLAAVQFVGLVFGLLAATRAITSRLVIALVGLVLIVWMIPCYKSFEHTIALAAVYFAVCLLERPSLLRHFMGGAFVGFSAFFGRNHGLYNFLAFFCIILFLHIKIERGRPIERLVSWGTGIVVGYSPMLIMWALVPGFWDGFVRVVAVHLRASTTNLSLSVPWPWTIDYRALSLIGGLRHFFYGLSFALIPLLFSFAAIIVLLSKRNDIQSRVLLAASTFVGAFYSHHAFARADLSHLAQAIHPLLLGLVALPCALAFMRKKTAILGLAVLLSTTTALVPASRNNFTKKLLVRSSRNPFVQYDLLGDTIWIRNQKAVFLDGVMALAARELAPGEQLLIAPYSPGLYVALQRKSPLWNIGMLFPEDEKIQREMIQDLEENGVDLVLVKGPSLRKTHGLLWNHFMGEFEPIMPPPFSGYIALRRRRI